MSDIKYVCIDLDKIKSIIRGVDTSHKKNVLLGLLNAYLIKRGNLSNREIINLVGLYEHIEYWPELEDTWEELRSYGDVVLTTTKLKIARYKEKKFRSRSN